MNQFPQAHFLSAAHLLKQLPPQLLPEIAFAGRSNVGKSSLINCVLGRKGLVKTSSKPGKTQSLNYFAIGDFCYFVDLPGYGYAQVSQKQRHFWQELVGGYVEGRQALALVVVIVDLRHPVKELDRELVDWLKHIGRSFLVVYTKADKLSRNEQQKNALALDAGFNMAAAGRVLFSAQTGQGKAELIEKITGLVQKFELTKEEPIAPATGLLVPQPVDGEPRAEGD